jgi:hypothetical protein
LWARSSESAIEKARENVTAGLRNRPAVNRADIDQLRLDVDEVEALGLLGLLERQGFVFYPLDENAEDQGAN